MLAWIRTGLAMMGFGFVVARFNLFMREFLVDRSPELVRTPGLSLWIGILLVFLGTIVSLFAGVQHARRIKCLKAGQPIVETLWPMGRIVSVVLAAVGAVMTAYLVFLRSI